MNCIHHLLLLLSVTIAKITKSVETKLTKIIWKIHHQKISVKLTCILVLVVISSFKGRRFLFHPFYFISSFNYVRKLKFCTFSCQFHEMVSDFTDHFIDIDSQFDHFMKWTGGSSILWNGRFTVSQLSRNIYIPKKYSTHTNLVLLLKLLCAYNACKLTGNHFKPNTVVLKLFYAWLICLYSSNI